MWLCGWVESCLGPGALDGADFGVCGSERGVGRKSGGDDRAAELDGGVGKAGSVFDVYQGWRSRRSVASAGWCLFSVYQSTTIV